MKWTKEEVEFFRTRVGNGVHPIDALPEYEEKFKKKRTRYAALAMCWREKISYQTLKEGRWSSQLSEEEALREETVLKALRSELGALRTKYAKLAVETNLQERLLEFARDFVPALPKVREPKKERVLGKPSVESMVLLLSDLHAGEIVRADEMNGLNEYNFEICVRRLKFIVECISNLMQNKLKGYQFDELHIFLLGDMVSGVIHQELLEQTEGTILEWTVNLAYVLAQMIRELLLVFPRIHLTGVVGNHGRMTKDVRFKSRHVNWDYICYQMVSCFLHNEPRITFDFPKSFWTLKTVKGHNFMLLHGDNIKSWMGIPWYGIQRTIANLKEMLETQNKRFQYIVLGHFHNRGVLDRVRGEAVINGSLIGGNEFSVGALFTSTEACQHLFGVHPEEGTTFSYKVKVQRATKDGPIPYQYLDLGISSMGDEIRKGLAL